MNRCKRRLTGFTLLELILALAISVIIVGAIASSIYVCISTLTLHQKEIEQKQIARNVISMISADIRAALQYKPADVTGLQDLAVSQAMVAGISTGSVDDETVADAAGDGGGGEAPAEGETGGVTSPDPADTGDGAAEPAMDPEECVSCRPTMIGTETLLLVDVSRLPRIDEYNPMVAMRTDPQLPSDVKGVTYFVSEPGSGTTSSGSGNRSMFEDEVAQLGGMYRRQIDRAVAAYADEQGIVSAVDNYTELIAPEVAEINFRYFDGTDWVTTWDSIEQDAFPPAIEVTVVIDPMRVQSVSAGTDYEYPGFDPATMLRYRKVIHLPIADLPEE